MSIFRNTLLVLQTTGIILILLYNSTPSLAQLSQGGQPYSRQYPQQLLPTAYLPTYTLPPVDRNKLQAEDAINDTDKSQPYRFGVPFPSDITLQNNGVWETLPNGDRIWRLAIYGKNANTLHLIYRYYHLPPTATFYIYTPQYTQQLGAFTDINNKPHHRFSTGLLKGEITLLEYYEPAAVAGQGRIEIETIVYGYRGWNTPAPEKGFDDSGSCNNNINCPEGADWQNEKRAVVLIISDGFRSCTGAMLNNVLADCTPYLLTANHCLEPNVETWLFMFNYESPNCQNIDGPTDQVLSGSQLLASNGSSDFALLELSEPPPPDYNVFFSGWNANSTPAQSTVGIHHPSGDIKKITFNDNSPLLSDNFTQVPNSHWEISEWEDGTTEPGSSGSPLFDQNHYIIGQLHGGNASCSSPNEYDAYGSFAYSWNTSSLSSQRLRDWLDPTNSGALVLQGRDCTTPPPPYDVALQFITSPAAITCETSIAPIITMRNKGTEDLTQVEISYTIDNGITYTYIWQGNLAPYNTINITLPEIAASIGTHSLFIVLSNPNGQPNDAFTANNQLNQPFTVADGGYLTVNLTTDNDSDETSFAIYDEQNNPVYTETEFGDNTTYSLPYCLPEGCYNFVIYDEYGDGICCVFGQGLYELILPDGTIAARDSIFQDSETTSFCIAGSGSTSLAQFSASATSICVGDTVVFSASTPNLSYYRWQIPDLGFDSGETTSSTLTMPFNIAGQYSISLTITNNTTSQTLTKPAYIKVLQPQISASIAHALTPIDSNGSVSLSASNGEAPYIFTWSDGTIASNRANLQVGTYTISVTDALGCQAVQTITVDSFIPRIEILNLQNLSPQNEICQGNQITFSATTNRPNSEVSWQWALLAENNNQPIANAQTPNNATLALSEVSVYTLMLVVNDSYTADTAFLSLVNLLVQPAPQVELQIINGTLPDNMGEVSAITNPEESKLQYAWSNGTTLGSSSISLPPGNYTLTVTQSETGCQAVLPFSIETDINAPDGVLIYSTPASEYIGLYSMLDTPFEVIAYNLAGQKITTYYIQKGNNSLSTESFANGLYILSYSINGKKADKKIAIVR